MFSPSQRAARWSVAVVALAFGLVTGSSAFAHGGGGGGGGGHGGGGGGGHSGGHSSGGYHSGGYSSGGYHTGGYHPGTNNGGIYYFGGFGGLRGFYGYGYGNGYGYGGYYGNGYGYGYGNGYYGNGYGYYDNGYTYPYGFVDPGYVAATDGATQPAPGPYGGPAQGRFLGIDEMTTTDASGSGVRVLRVEAGSPAELAGLQPGDVIHAAGGYLIQQTGNLGWVIAQTPPGGLLEMTVRTAADGREHLITAKIP